MNSQIETSNNIVINKSEKHILSKVLCMFFVAFSFLCFYAALWYVNTYGNTGFDSILFTLFSNLNGVQTGLVAGLAIWSVIPSILSTAAVGVALYFKPKKKFKFYPVKHKFTVIISVVLSVVLILTAMGQIEFFDYLYNLRNQSVIFTEDYVDPDDVKITFPEKKRNLIYIFLESMETTFMSEELGGALKENTIPELYMLARKNVSFSHNDGIGGFVTPKGTTWTVAAMTAQTAGIPLKAPGLFERNKYGKDSFLPGATTITNILEDNGYNQALMFGSDDVFANRDVYYKDHGIDVIYDLDTAREEGLIPENYYVWWGMEDAYLFDYAKDKLTELSKQEEPFSFTMLTVDTHHVSGYKCEECGDKYEEQYENVMACSSRQVNKFVNWLKRQSFYKDTTVVICGDHQTMDSDYIERNVDPEYERHIYNCILNSQAKTDNYKNRQFSGMDLFPTTLAAMGCEIEGDRLGLGTNLFSERPTLIEEMGYDEFNHQLTLNSSEYISKFMMDQK